MFNEYRDSYVSKYEDAFTAYLADVVNNGTHADAMGDQDGPGSLVHVGGKHVLLYVSTGAVYRHKMDATELAEGFQSWAESNYPDIAAWDAETWDAMA